MNLPFPRNVVQVINHENRVVRPKIAHIARDPYDELGAKLELRRDLNHPCVRRPTGLIRVGPGAKVALRRARRTAVHRYMACDGRVAGFGGGGRKTPDPETVHVEGGGVTTDAKVRGLVSAAVGSAGAESVIGR